jgi:hypothetical protein
VERWRRWRGVAPGLLELGIRRRAKNGIGFIGSVTPTTAGVAVAEPNQVNCRKATEKPTVPEHNRRPTPTIDSRHDLSQTSRDNRLQRVPEPKQV